MTAFLWTIIAVAAGLVLYAYAGYPALLALIGRWRHRGTLIRTDVEVPDISIVVPAYNEAHQIRVLLESLLAVDYPAERRQILVISDASTDGTDEIVRDYADRGVELLRMPERVGKTAAENASCAYLRGEIVINTDASTRIHPHAVR
ncbi:MAG: glycosyltransferase, partial [Longimicrobiales bacterium]